MGKKDKKWCTSKISDIRMLLVDIMIDLKLLLNWSEVWITVLITKEFLPNSVIFFSPVISRLYLIKEE